jgi:hypothetical protein
VWHAGTGRADPDARDAPAPETVPLELVLSRAGQQAVALAQQEKSTWTRADLVKYLGRVLPRTGRDPAQAAALLEDLADRALRSEFEPVLCLEAPEPAEAPRALLRADGRSVYRNCAHGVQLGRGDPAFWRDPVDGHVQAVRRNRIVVREGECLLGSCGKVADGRVIGEGEVPVVGTRPGGA